MRPIFTIHAGEYLLGSHIEKSFKGLNVWVPSKDTGIDLLVTDKEAQKTVSIQVKFSANHLPAYGTAKHTLEWSTWGWWTLNPKKLEKSKADLWVLITIGGHRKKMQYIVISPEELYKSFSPLHVSKEKWQVYLKVPKDNKRCIVTRSMTSTEEIGSLNQWLNNWKSIAQLV